MRALIETHARICLCSYCHGDYKLHYGLNIPDEWRAWNAWWVIKYGPKRYLRFHWPEWFYAKRAPKLGSGTEASPSHSDATRRSEAQES
jgi:hypothetical protein